MEAASENCYFSKLMHRRRKRKVGLGSRRVSSKLFPEGLREVFLPELLCNNNRAATSCLVDFND